MHVDHSDLVADRRLPAAAAIIVIGLCSLTAWATVLWLGLALSKVVGLR